MIPRWPNVIKQPRADLALNLHANGVKIQLKVLENGDATHGRKNLPFGVEEQMSLHTRQSQWLGMHSLNITLTMWWLGGWSCLTRISGQIAVGELWSARRSDTTK